MEMLQIENCVSICPAESAMCGVECAKNYNPLGVLYNRVGGSIPAGSEQLYDFCDFYLATEGMQAVATIGELWVTYEIELLTPILGGGQIGNQINFAHYTIGSGVTTSAYFGTTIPTSAGNTNVSTMDLTFTNTTITLPSSVTTGAYCMQYILYGVASSVTPPTVAFTTNCAALPVLISGVASAISPTGTNVNNLVKIVYFYVTGPSAVLTFSSGTIVGTQSSGDITISQVPWELVSGV
jgi:hypothetical protein